MGKKASCLVHMCAGHWPGTRVLHLNNVVSLAVAPLLLRQQCCQSLAANPLSDYFLARINGYRGRGQWSLISGITQHM